MSRRYLCMALLLVALLVGGSAARAADPELSGDVTVLMAASLADLFNKSKAEFEQAHPSVHIQIQPGGSLSLTHQILDLNKEADIIAVADATIIPQYLLPKHVEWSIDFMTEQIVLIVAEEAKYADEITSDNWYQILLRPDVEYGISDPDKAPVGYRSLMTWQLAEDFYNKPGLYTQLREKMPLKNIRSNAIASLALLTNGELDYLFDYASLATQHHLRMITLPAEVNLSRPQFADRYATARVDIPGKTPGTTQEIRGKPIVYSIAMLSNAKNRAAAEAFIDFLVGARGRQLAENVGMTPLTPAVVVGKNLPKSLQATLAQD